MYLGSDGVLDAHHHDAGEVVQDVVLVVPVGLAGLGGEVAVGHADGAQAVAGHGLDHAAHHVVAVLGAEATRLTFGVQDVGASWGGGFSRKQGQITIGSALLNPYVHWLFEACRSCTHLLYVIRPSTK